jgi:tetratricopeptide (TPR) repeat protein
MDNLAASGQLDLGNLYLRANTLELAEPVFRRALDISRRAKVPRLAARAQASLGALLEQLHRPAEATPLMEAALLFYSEAGYRRESVQAATVLGGLHRLAGDSAKAIQVLTEALPFAVQLDDQRVEAQIRDRLADSLSDRGDWSAALAEYERASQLYGPTVSGQTARDNAARLRARIGTNAKP